MAIKVIKLVHRGYTEFERANEKGIKLRQLFGKFQYIFSSEKGKISMVQLKNYFYSEGTDFWEIYCLEGKLFDDVERFDTKKGAEKRVRSLLE